KTRNRQMGFPQSPPPSHPVCSLFLPMKLRSSAPDSSRKVLSPDVSRAFHFPASLSFRISSEVPESPPHRPAPPSSAGQRRCLSGNLSRLKALFLPGRALHSALFPPQLLSCRPEDASAAAAESPLISPEF